MNNRDEFDDPKGNDLLGSIGPKAAFFIVLIALSFMIGVVWKLYVGGGSHDGQNVPIVRADTTPYKVEPDDPGGMEMPHKDSTIFSSLNSDPDADKGIENLLAEEDGEEPVPRSQLFAGLNTERNPDLNAETQETPLDKPLNEDAEPVVAEAKDKEEKAVVTNLVEDSADTIIEVPKKVEPISLETATSALVEKDVKSEDAEQAQENVQENAQESAQAKLADAEKLMAEQKAKEKAAAEAKAKAEAEAKKKADEAKAIAAQKAKEQEQAAIAAKKKAEADAAKAKAATAQKAKEQADAAKKAAAAEPKAVVTPPPVIVNSAATSSNQTVGDYYVQLASVQDRSRTESEWSKLKKKYGSVLSGYNYRVETANLAKGTYYRIQAGPVGKTQANATCNAIKRTSPSGCIVKKK